MSSHIQTHVDSLFVHLFITLVHTQLKLAKVGLESSGQADYMLYMRHSHQQLTDTHEIVQAPNL